MIAICSRFCSPEGVKDPVKDRQCTFFVKVANSEKLQVIFLKIVITIFSKRAIT